MNLGIHDDIHYLKSKLNTTALLEVRVRMKLVSVVIIGHSPEYKKSINCFSIWSDFAEFSFFAEPISMGFMHNTYEN